MATKAEEATTIRLIEISKKESDRIKENPGFKVTKEVVLQVEEEVMVKSQTRVIFSVVVPRKMGIRPSEAQSHARNDGLNRVANVIYS